MLYEWELNLVRKYTTPDFLYTYDLFIYIYGLFSWHIVTIEPGNT